MNPLGLQGLADAYRGRRVLVTGHTGFKGSWLSLWLDSLGATVTGYALAPPTRPSLYELLDMDGVVKGSVLADLRDSDRLEDLVARTEPHIVFHLAAQSLVRASYRRPQETIETNVMGTVHLLEAVRRRRLPVAVVAVTSDKCYENRQTVYGYREEDALGGHDVYAMSKAAAELVVASYRRSFFPVDGVARHGVRVASARAGNVIGGGDWAHDRLVPDCVRAAEKGQPIRVRNPGSIRPWQHVLEPLGAYLLLGARLLDDTTAPDFCEAWNFGPSYDGTRTVREVVDAFVAHWGAGASWEVVEDGALAESATLRLSIDKATARLAWFPRWGLDTAMGHTVNWYKRSAKSDARERRELCRRQIEEYSTAP